MDILTKQLARLHAGINMLSPIPEDAWSSAESLFKYRAFNTGEHVIRSGDITTELYFMTSGLARFYYIDGEGKEYNKAFALPGEALSSLSSLLTGMTSPFNVQAMSDLEGLTLPYSHFIDLAERHPAWRLLQVRMLEQLLIKKERREADFLILSAAERYRNFLQEYPQLADNIPNYHIASYLGITEVALSRIRNRMGLTRVNDTV